MINNHNWAILNEFHEDPEIAKELLYGKCGFDRNHSKLIAESKDYGAGFFELNGKRIQHRISKITPKKTGQFVAIWKRNKEGITAPYDCSDDLDFLIITSGTEKQSGQFVFPKSVLEAKGIISKNGKGGKRGIRVYPPWDKATNKQAMETQKWQVKYFLSINH
ncbi:MepB family protein [Pedobacter gandavensis]|uniref:MepB family protein n=1 Tax=Pedobacter gandavensis TaxID=2679963 RepID=UPI00292EF6A5|nr:MepB family protein [Pedobacter gandavensis]